MKVWVLETEQTENDLCFYEEPTTGAVEIEVPEELWEQFSKAADSYWSLRSLIEELLPQNEEDVDA